MRLVLEDKAAIHSVDVVAVLECGQQRPDLAALCRLGVPEGRLDVSSLQAGIPGFSERACENLVRSLHALELCGPKGVLTDAGRECGQTGVAFLAERRAVRLWMAHRDGLGTVALGWEPLRTRDQLGDAAEELSTDHLPAGQATWTSVLDGAAFRVRSFVAPRGEAPRGVRRRRTPAQVRWEIDGLTGQNAWTMSGELAAGGGRVRFETEPAQAPARPLAGMLARLDPSWNARRGLVTCAFDGLLGPHGQDDFTRARRWQDVCLPGHGRWPEVVAAHVPVGPVDGATARTWADALVLARLRAQDRYVRPGEPATVHAQVVAGTPLAPLAPPVPSIQDLARSADDRLRWLLLAPLELPLEAA